MSHAVRFRALEALLEVSRGGHRPGPVKVIIKLWLIQLLLSSCWAQNQRAAGC